MKMFYDMLKPKSFMIICTHILRFNMVIIILCLISFLHMGFFLTMDDFQQGENFRIFHLHVSAAWIALCFYGILAICSFIYLMYKSYLIHVMGQAFAHMGLYFSMITLMTGSFWGRPTWGTFWVWDARLTSVFILFLLYVTYVLFNKIHDMSIKTMNQSSILVLVGFINIPIIKYSVQWWNTLHQSESVTPTHISMDSSIYIPLLLCFIGILSYNTFGVLLEMRISILKRKMESYYV